MEGIISRRLPILILKRKVGDFISVGEGDSAVRVYVVSIGKNTVRLGVEAPDGQIILRGPELISEDGTRKDHSLKPPGDRV